MTTEAQKAAKKRYKAKVKCLTLSFYPPEADIWDHLNSQEVKQTYLKDLIRKDLENKKRGDM